MKPGTKQRLLRELGWFGSLAAMVSLLLGLAFVRLESSRAGVASLRGEVAQKTKRLRTQRLSALDQEELRTTDDTLAECRESAASQSLRSAAIASAADQAGVTLLSLRDGGSDPSADEHVVTYAHELIGLGSYHQIATFLDALYTVPGLVAVEDLELKREGETGSGPLRAAMQVTWFAPGVAPAQEETEAGP